MEGICRTVLCLWMGVTLVAVRRSDASCVQYPNISSVQMCRGGAVSGGRIQLDASTSAGFDTCSCAVTVTADSLNLNLLSAPDFAGCQSRLEVDTQSPFTFQCIQSGTPADTTNKKVFNITLQKTSPSVTTDYCLLLQFKDVQSNDSIQVVCDGFPLTTTVSTTTSPTTTTPTTTTMSTTTTTTTAPTTTPFTTTIPTTITSTTSPTTITSTTSPTTITSTTSPTTINPTTESPTTSSASSPTQSPPTQSPPTMSPPTQSPPTQSPPTMSPPTQPPTTQSPTTQNPSSDSSAGSSGEITPQEQTTPENGIEVSTSETTNATAEPSPSSASTAGAGLSQGMLALVILMVIVGVIIILAAVVATVMGVRKRRRQWARFKGTQSASYYNAGAQLDDLHFSNGKVANKNTPPSSDSQHPVIYSQSPENLDYHL